MITYIANLFKSLQVALDASYLANQGDMEAAKQLILENN